MWQEEFDIVYCRDKILLHIYILKNIVNLPRCSFNNIFQDSFNTILSQQLTHERPCMYEV